MSSPQGSGRKRSTKMANHLLGFSMSRDAGMGSYRPSMPRHRQHYVFDRSAFLAANFRFGVSGMNGMIDTGIHSCNVDWEDVVFLDMEVPILDDGLKTMRCPISLDEIELPYITPCGHVFSLVSLLTDMLMKHDGVLRGTSPCPICTVEIRAMELRPVHIRYVTPPVPGTVGDFSLVWRYRESTVVHEQGEDIGDLYEDGSYPIVMPRFSRSVVVENPQALWKYIACSLAEKSEEIRLEGGQDAACYYPGYLAAIEVVIDHCKRIVAGHRPGEGNIDGEGLACVDEIRDAVKHVIESSQASEVSRLRNIKLEEEFPSLSVSAAATRTSTKGDPQAMHASASWRTCNVHCSLPTEPSPSDGSAKMYMYQKSDGQWSFLNLLNMKMMHAWKGRYEDMPPRICAKMLDVERFEQTEDTKKRMRPFSHIPIRANITLCEADMCDTIPLDVMKGFEEELSKRRAKRESLAKQRARMMRSQRRAEQESKKRDHAVVDFRHMPPLGNADQDTDVVVDSDRIPGDTEDQTGVSFAKIAELGFAALGPSLTDGERQSFPRMEPPGSVWISKNPRKKSDTADESLPSGSGMSSGRKKGSKQILLLSTSMSHRQR